MKTMCIASGTVALLAALNAAAGKETRGYFDAPYHRYEAESARRLDGAVLRGPTLDQHQLASQASDMQYVELPSRASALEWTIAHDGCDGVTLRFTMPDRRDGWRQRDLNARVPQYRRDDVFDGSLDVFVNGRRRSILQYGRTSERIPLSSYWMWQYMTGDRPADEPDGSYEVARFAFDEVHFMLDSPLRKGDVVRLANGDGRFAYGVDFIEIEKVPAPVARPAGALSVADYGTGREAIDRCLADCVREHRAMYFPAGVWEYWSDVDDNRWLLNGASGITITGAGIWHTNLHFPSSRPFGGGVGGNRDAVNLEFCNLYLSSMLRSRCNQNAVYKGIMEAWGEGARLHDLWIEHFECGMWLGDYQGPARPTVNCRIYSCRLRNNLADGINLCQGTSSTTIEHCSFRGNGDDAIAIWNNDACGAVDATNDVIRCNTVENNWRAAGIAIFGGDGHEIANNVVKDCYKGAGIRLNTDFPGHHFANTKEIRFVDNTIVNCGTSWDCYGVQSSNRPSERGAVDVQGDVRNILFRGTVIERAHRCALQLREHSQGFLKFVDTTVDGIGLDGGDKSRYTHAGDIGPGCVIYLSGGVKPTFDGLTVRNVARERLLNELSSDGKGLVWAKPPVFE